ncbi:hypothetical protein [Salinimicrobium terrae]|uniref:hypothetical protein n=1 Tax=Salinimicrobium terrae TaxID=470866 RepID=UPI0012EB2A19|nr:hypothetical protein [Salinimicrobium terrae]
MKLDILFVDFVLVAAVFLSYFLFILIGRKESGRLKNKFSEETKKHQLRFEEKDSWNNNIIGLDKEKNKILLVQKKRTELVSEIIDLKQVCTCEILQEVQTLKIEQRTETILQRLDLQLKLHNGTMQIVNLYNCEETYMQDYELKHAEKWNRTINALISLRPNLNSAA